MLTDIQITKFQKIYLKCFGGEISRKEVLEKGTKLVRLMQIVYQPMTKGAYERLQKRRKQTQNL